MNEAIPSVKARQAFHVRLLVSVFVVLSIAASAHAQHLHVQVSYNTATQWRLFLYDFDSGEFDPSQAQMVVVHPAFSFVPANSFTNFLGGAGSTVWTLPETEIANLLYLGLGTSGIALGTFADNQISLHLRSVSGPGHFALYNVDPFGSPVVHMNTRDGIDPAVDSLPLSAVGGHVHVNWAFSAPGTYRVGFAASGRIAANGQTTTSPVVEYTFNVEDIPWRPRLEVSRGVTGDAISFTVIGEAGRHCRVWRTQRFQTWTVVTNFPMTSPTQTVAVPALINASPSFFKVSLE